MSSQSNVATKARAAEPKAQRWQQRKAAMTRDSILQSSVKILVENGYAGLTTVNITNAAQVSRGALHHHYPSRTDLLGGIIDHVLQQRLHSFMSEYVSKIEKSDPSEFINVGAEVHWDSLLSDEFTAYLELAMAARTDKELADLLIPATNKFDREWMHAAQRAFPQWDGKSKAIELASDFATAFHVGLLINRPFMQEKTRDQAARNKLLEVLKDIYATA